MFIRDCAGGIVFFENQVLLIQNDKAEWSFPKGVRHEDMDDHALSIYRVKFETGVRAYILGLAGKTSYEFYSRTRQQPVANRISWYIMTASSADTAVNREYGLADAKFFPVSKALGMVTYSQERELLTTAYQKYLELSRSDA